MNRRVDDPSVPARYAAEEDAEQEAQRHAYEADGERDAGCVDHPRQQISPLPVTPQQEERRVEVANADEVDAAGNESPQLVGMAANQESDRHLRLRIGYVRAQKRLLVDDRREPIDERAQAEPPFRVDEANPDRRGKDVFGKTVIGIGRCDELGEDRDEVHGDQKVQRDHGRPMLAELQPHQPPLTVDVPAFRFTSVGDLRLCRRARQLLHHAPSSVSDLVESYARVDRRQQDV